MFLSRSIHHCTCHPNSSEHFCTLKAEVPPGLLSHLGWMNFFGLAGS
jgi:hypothetical protein